MSEGVRVGGREVAAERVAVVAEQERRNEYLLSDGNTLRLRTVLTMVRMLPEETARQGKPVYAYETQIVVAVDQPARRAGLD
jgi:hypothetical protein